MATGLAAAWLSTAVAAPAPAGTDESQFPRYPELAPKVAFWTDVFARYSLQDGIVHSAAYPHIVLEVLHFEADTPRPVRSRRETESREAMRAALMRVQAGAHQPDQLSAADRALYERFAGIQAPDRFRRAADSLRVQRGIRERTEQALEVSGKYLPMMESTFQRYQLPVALTRLPIVESSFNVEAYSKVGAAGLWQFIPSSARLYMRLDEAIDDRRDPWISTDAAARHLRDDFDRLGNWPLAITAYNHGRNGVARGLQETGGSTLVDLIQRYENRRFGFASQNFYAEFLAAKDIEREAVRYFPSLQRQQPVDFTEIKVEHFVPYPSLLRLSGVDAELFQRLNPGFSAEVRNGQLWVPKGHAIRLPPTQAEAFRVGYARLPSAERAQQQRSFYREHRVRSGEALGSIARRYGVSVRTLQQANDIRDPSRIRVGQRLKVPPPGTSTTGPASARLQRVELRTHTVRQGQTLSSIARQYGVSVQQLRDANSLGNQSLIRPGQRLRIPN